MVLQDPSDRQETGKYMATPAPGWLNIIQGSTHVYVRIQIVQTHTYNIYTYTQTPPVTVRA